MDWFLNVWHAKLKAALLEYQATTVLPYTVYSKDDANGDPRLNAPTFDAGTYAGVWTRTAQTHLK